MPKKPATPQENLPLSEALGVDLRSLAAAENLLDLDRPLDALERLRDAQHAIDTLQLYAIRSCRSPQPRFSWQQIATRLNVSKQAAQRRFAHKIT